VPFDDEREAEYLVNGTKYGLNAAVFGSASQAFKSAVAAQHKCVFYDETAVSPNSLDRAAWVGGYKRSAFVGELVPSRVQSSAAHAGRELTYAMKQGCFSLERELSSTEPYHHEQKRFGTRGQAQSGDLA
jgi:hypothetical protein